MDTNDKKPRNLAATRLYGWGWIRLDRMLVPGTGLEPVSLAAADFKSAVYTSFTTRAGGGLSHRWMPAHSALLGRPGSSGGDSPIRARETSGIMNTQPNTHFFGNAQKNHWNPTP